MARVDKKMSAEQALEFLEHPTKDLTLYSILRRNAGWGIQWHSQYRQENPPQYVHGPNRTERGLFVNRYYPTFTEMVVGETKWAQSAVEGQEF